MHTTILAGGRLIDGTGSAARPADVFLEGDLIARVAVPAESHAHGATVVPCHNLTIAPGFIDVHSHADCAAFLAQPDTGKIVQGVTTEVVGNCGITPFPRSDRYAKTLRAYAGRLFPEVAWHGSSFSDYWADATGHGLVTNAAPLVGQGALRIAVMGMAMRAATATERRRMRDLLHRALDAGAFGLSTGLVYPPGVFTGTEELMDLAGALGGGALYATHVRGEGDHLEASITEAIAIGRGASVRVELSHHKAAGPANWGKTEHTLALIDKARADGVDVRLDVYPYTVSATELSACLPPWAQEGGDEALLARLGDPAALSVLCRDLEQGGSDWENLLALDGPERLAITAGRGRRSPQSRRPWAATRRRHSAQCC